MKSLKILMLTTSHDMLGDTNNMTGVWLEEIAVAYYTFKEADAELTITSPKGGQVPIDPKSESIIVATAKTKQFLKDMEAIDFLSHSSLLEDIEAKDFDALYVAGGRGALWDIANSETVKLLIEAFNNENKPIALVCHSVAALTAVQDKNGAYLVKGKLLTGFSDSEEESAGLTQVVPFLVETELVALGAVYSKGENYLSHVIADGNIITGQNPASTEDATKQLLAMYKLQKYRLSDLEIVS